MNGTKATRFLPLFLCVCVFTALTAGCSSTNTGNKAGNDVKTIGIIQIAEHPALDAARQGFLDELQAQGYIDGENVKINTYNAQGDSSNLKTMSQRLVQDKSDIILAIATPAAQTIASETTTIPIVVTAVTDPETAQLVETNEKPNTNVTGTSDMNPVKKQLELLKNVLPDTKTLGIIYNSSEDNSQLQADLAVEIAAGLGLETVVAHVTSTNDVSQVTESIVGKIDALYAPTDNTIAAAIASVLKITNEKKIPFVFGEEAGVEAGALMTDGISYYNLGRQTGTMAIDILEGKSVPADMPIQYIDQTTIVVNQVTADLLGVTIPADVLETARIITE